ncbi:MAG: class I SAM-dependent methyltransferase, partial [Thermoflexales bacterium]
LCDWDLLWLEPSSPAAEAARRLGLRVITGTLEETDFSARCFDAVTLWDVIEHLHDPAGALRRIARILKPDGILVIRTPNFDSWEARLFGRYWAGLEPPRHLFVFTPRTLGAMLAQAGFAIRHQDCRSGGYMAFLRSVQFRLTFSCLSDRLRALLMGVLYHPLARAIAAPFFTLSSLGLKGGQMVLVASPTSSCHD